jgi:hypothetical protein
MSAAFDLVQRADQYKAGLYEFFLDPSSWRKFDPGIVLNWQRVKFDASSKSAIPQERGLYIFTLEVENLGLPGHGYILYVGITGNTSQANLQKRYAQYLREANEARGRPKVVYMLNKWAGELTFNFMPVPDTSVDLAKIEKSFLNSIMPPVNSSDFDAEIAAAKKAVF